MKPQLNKTDFAQAAALLNCEAAVIEAVCAVEAPKGGFLPDGRPIVLFEGHVFYRLVGGKFAKTHPSLCVKTWTRAHYAKTAALEWERLGLAVGLDREAALKSASWGKFQILGENYRFCGFDSVQQFVNAMYRSEAEHLNAFVSFVRHMRIDDELQRKDWAGFARVYNGPGYAKNQYDAKMQAAYERVLCPK